MDVGTIHCSVNNDFCKKLAFLDFKLNEIFKKYNPQYCCIEEPPLAISGVKVLISLSRINGVCLMNAAKCLDSNKIFSVEPKQWKALSFNGINGNSSKAHIQFYVCKYFNKFISNEDVEFIQNKINSFNDIDESYIECRHLKKEFSVLKRSLSKKKITNDEKVILNRSINEVSEKVDTLKKVIKHKEKTIIKELDKLSKRILELTTISSDMADSVSIAYHMGRILNNDVN